WKPCASHAPGSSFWTGSLVSGVQLIAMPVPEMFDPLYGQSDDVVPKSVYASMRQLWFGLVPPPHWSESTQACVSPWVAHSGESAPLHTPVEQSSSKRQALPVQSSPRQSVFDVHELPAFLPNRHSSAGSVVQVPLHRKLEGCEPVSVMSPSQNPPQTGHGREFSSWPPARKITERSS